jgi:hypothetical protein
MSDDIRTSTRLDRAIATVTLLALVVASASMLLGLTTAGAQEPPPPTVLVNDPVAAGETTFSPAVIQVPLNGQLVFEAAQSDGFTYIDSEDPAFAFESETGCFLFAAGETCTVTVVDANEQGEVLYAEQADAGGSTIGKVTVTGASPSPSGSSTASASPSPSSSASATPSTSASPTASPSGSPSASPTASSTASPTASPSVSPSPTTSPTPGPTVHPRALTIEMRGALIVSGTLSSDDPGCYRGAPVDVQKRVVKKRNGKKVVRWKKITRDITNFDGEYEAAIAPKKGRYRTRSIKYSDDTGMQICAFVVSPVRRYRP